MFESQNAKANTVSAKNQLADDARVKIVREPGSQHKVLFVGNSITRHEPKPEIGWYGDWGMAASSEEKDYVHRVAAGLRKEYGAVDYCIAQMADWERDYLRTTEILEQYYCAARDFGADIVVIRIGENVDRELNMKISWKPYYDQMIRFFAGESVKKVVVTDDFWRSDAIDDIIREVAEENHYIFCQLSDLELDESTMAKGLFEHGGVAAHPGDYGMECIAERILKCIL